MFDVSLDECERIPSDNNNQRLLGINEQNARTGDDETEFSEEELMNAMESQNMMISILQREVEIKTRICEKLQKAKEE